MTCFLPGRAKDLSAPPNINGVNKTIEVTITYGHAVNSTVILIGLILAVVLMMNLHYTKLGSGGCYSMKTDFVTFIYISTHFVSKNLIVII